MSDPIFVKNGKFDPMKAARWHAKLHYKSDKGVQDVYYFPSKASEREIRILGVNKNAFELSFLEPLDFGVDYLSPDNHTLIVLDVTPSQWDRISSGRMKLPDGWSVSDAERIPKTGVKR